MIIREWGDSLALAIRRRSAGLSQMLVMLVLAPAVIAGSVLAVRRELLATLLLASAAALWAILLWRRLGRFEYIFLVLLLSGGLLNFFTLPTGTASRIVISLLIGVVMIGFWLVYRLLGRREPLKPSLITKPLLAFVAANVIAYGWSLLLRDPGLFVWGGFGNVQVAALVVNISLPLLALVVANQIGEERWLRWLVWAMVGMGALYLVLFFLELPIANYVLTNGSRGLFSAWVAVLAYGLALYDEDLPLFLRALLILLLMAIVYRFFFIGRSWVSGWLPMGVACALLTFVRSKRLFVLMLVVGTLYLALNFDYYWENIVVAEEQGGSGTGRVALWMRNLTHVANHPVFGMGPAGYAIYNMTYHPGDARSTHNNYFDVLAQTGVIGFVLFIWLLAAFLRTAIRVSRATAGQRSFAEAFAHAALAGCVGAIVSMMLGDWVLPFAYNQTISGFDNALYTWLFLGGMVSLHHLVTGAEAFNSGQPLTGTGHEEVPVGWPRSSSTRAALSQDGRRPSPRMG